jgi:peptide-methionine (S)-S-oxide reductase
MSGRQYRSAIFYNSEAQKTAANAFIAKLKASKAFSKPIVTEVVPLGEFFVAEDYHQDFMKKNPDHPYIVYHDVPKVAALKKQFSELYVEK